MTKLIVDFRNFANTPNNAENIAQAAPIFTCMGGSRLQSQTEHGHCSWFSSV